MDLTLNAMNALEAMRYDDLRRLFSLRTWIAGGLTAIMLFGIFGAAAVEAQTLAQRDRDEVRIHPLESDAEGAVEALKNQEVVLDLQEASFEEAIWTVARAGQLGLSYNPDLLPEREVTLQEELSVEEALQRLLAPTKLKALISSNREIVLVERGGADGETVQARSMEEIIQYVDVEGKGASGTSQDQASRPLQGTITGTVTDSVSGDPLPGVNVVISGTTQGTATGPQGTFTISNVEPGTYDLQASFIGYEPKTVENVEVSEGEATEVNFSLAPSTLQLDEVVAVGYGEQEQQDLTGAISSVSGEDISDLPVMGIEDALQGKVAGVDVRPASGEPGSAALVKIRGVSTIGSTNPLYVIDGMPVINEATSYGSPNPLSLLNPDNIESVDVLKDASATAIYGSRAANGVILIETSRGQEGDTQVSFNFSGGVQRFANLFPMLNSEQFARKANDADEAAGLPQQEVLENPESIEQNTNWQEEAFRPAAVQDYSMSISGGSESARYAVSGGYLNQGGTLPESHYKRYNLRVNSDFDLHPDFQIQQSVMLGRANWEGGKASSSDLSQLMRSSPLLPVHDPDNLGGYAGPLPEIVGRNSRQNQVGIMNLVENTEVQNRVLGNVQADYEFIPNLSFRLNLGADYIFSEQFNFTPEFEMGTRSNPTASLSQSSEREQTFLIEPTLAYSNIFNEVHDFSSTVGFTQQETETEVLSGTKQEFPSNDLRTISAGIGGSTLSGTLSEWGMRSVFGRLNYSYDGKYLVTATLRRDGSSRFGPDSRWGNFPSFSLGWRISDEPFMQDISGLNSLKLRGGWGEVGNQAGIGNYASWSTIEPVADYILGEGQDVSPGAAPLSLGNTELSWESTSQINIGLDATLLNERLSVSADYYQKDTEGILLRVPINTTSGIFRNSGPVENAGGIQNSGFEFSAMYTGSTQSGFQYTISANLSTVTNEVTSLGGEDNIITEISGDPARALTKTTVGREIGAIYGYVMDGLFDTEAEVEEHAEQPGAAPGDVRFKDLNGDDVIDSEDRTIIGSPYPSFTYGVSTNFAYQRVDLSFVVDGVQGRDIYNLQHAELMDLDNDNNNLRRATERWTPENKDTNVPRAVSGDPNNNFRPSTRFLEDGSFLRISSVRLGYRFDVPNLTNEGTSSLRVYGAVQNAYVFTDYNGWNPDFGAPEGDPTLTQGVDPGHYPIARQWNLGLMVTF